MTDNHTEPYGIIIYMDSGNVLEYFFFDEGYYNDARQSLFSDDEDWATFRRNTDGPWEHINRARIEAISTDWRDNPLQHPAPPDPAE